MMVVFTQIKLKITETHTITKLKAKVDIDTLLLWILQKLFPDKFMKNDYVLKIFKQQNYL